MPPCRLHIFGASGSGVTSLGRALADNWSVPCHDTDDYYWLPTEPPFRQKRPIPDRVALMQALFLPRKAWVLAGSLHSWSAPLIAYFDAVVFVSLDNATRLARLSQREVHRLGAEAIKPGAVHHQAYTDFMDWADRYENPEFTGRSRASHEAWMATLSCPIIRVNSLSTASEMVDQINAALQAP